MDTRRASNSNRNVNRGYRHNINSVLVDTWRTDKINVEIKLKIMDKPLKK